MVSPSVAVQSLLSILIETCWDTHCSLTLGDGKRRRFPDVATQAPRSLFPRLVRAQSLNSFLKAHGALRDRQEIRGVAVACAGPRRSLIVCELRHERIVPGFAHQQAVNVPRRVLPPTHRDRNVGGARDEIASCKDAAATGG